QVQALVAADPGSPDTWMAAGFYLPRLGPTDPGVVAFERVLLMDPDAEPRGTGVGRDLRRLRLDPGGPSACDLLHGRCRLPSSRRTLAHGGADHVLPEAESSGSMCRGS